MDTQQQAIYDGIKAEGHSDSQIADAMCDGEFLFSEQIWREDAEEIYLYCKNKIRMDAGQN